MEESKPHSEELAKSIEARMVIVKQVANKLTATLVVSKLAAKEFSKLFVD